MVIALEGGVQKGVTALITDALKPYSCRSGWTPSPKHALKDHHEQGFAEVQKGVKTHCVFQSLHASLGCV